VTFSETICTRIALGELDSILNLRIVAILFASRHSSRVTWCRVAFSVRFVLKQLHVVSRRKWRHALQVRR